MNYTELAKEFLKTMKATHKNRSQKQMNEAMRGEAFVLQFIAEHNGEVVPGDINAEMNISSARIATVLNGLENKGFITRQIDSADRRRTILKLTPTGEEHSRRMMQILLGHMVKMLEFLGERDAQEYVRIMGRLANAAPLREMF